MKNLLTVLMVLMASQIAAQTLISGKVTDTKGTPIPSANVYLENTYDGATTDSEGKFSFTTEETGSQTLVVSYITFQTFKKTADIQELKELDIRLKEASNTLDVVELVAGSFQAGDNTKVSVMGPIDVVTTAGVAGDFISALQTLPGTQTVGEDGRLFVRGGTAEETKVFIDGLQVFQPYIPTANNTPTRGRYSPFLFDGITFSTGGYSAEYGNALSSVLLLSTIDEPEQNQTDFSFMSLGAGIGHTKKWEKDALTFNVSYINLAPYNELVPDDNIWNKLPESMAGEVIFRHRTENGLFKLYSAFDFINFDVEQEDIDFTDLVRFDLKNYNWYTNGSYTGFLGDQTKLMGGISYSTSKADLLLGTTDVINTEDALHTKIKLKHNFSNTFKLSYGAEYTTRTFKEESIIDQTNEFKTGFTDRQSAAFAETDIFFSTTLAAKLGVRASYTKLFDEYTVAPRLSIAYKFNKHAQLSLAYGQFYQTGQNDELKLTQDLRNQMAEHYILNYQFRKNRRSF